MAAAHASERRALAAAPRKAAARAARSPSPIRRPENWAALTAPQRAPGARATTSQPRGSRAASPSACPRT